jgi:pilus assembly protein CpaC
MRNTANLFCALLIWGATVVGLPAFAQDERTDWLEVEVGKSIVLEMPRTPTTIAMTDPNIINLQPLTTANKIQIQGLSIGTTDLIVEFGANNPPMIYEVSVNQDLSDLIRRIDSIVEGEPPRVYPLESRIVLEGTVDDLDTLEQVALVAQIYDPEFVNLMQVRGDHQVQLEVVFAEISRSATRQLGLNAVWGDEKTWLGLIGPQASTISVQNPGLNVGTNGGMMFGPGGTYGVHGWLGTIDLLAMLNIVEEYSLGKILAQPTLVSLSGQSSTFLAGGEVPLVQSQALGQSMTTFKPYGINLAFTPTVLAGNVIDILMSLEISEVDYGSTVRTGGGETPGFFTRKGSHHLRIESGMTFAVAGLIEESTSFARSSIPGLGSLPLVGALFRNVKHLRDEREVIVFITPRLVRPLAPGEVPAVPGSTENNNPSDFELFLLGTSSRPGSRTASPTGAIGLQR